jgi:hypothetical protein
MDLRLSSTNMQHILCISASCCTSLVSLLDGKNCLTYNQFVKNILKSLKRSFTTNFGSKWPSSGVYDPSLVRKLLSLLLLLLKLICLSPLVPVCVGGYDIHTRGPRNKSHLHNTHTRDHKQIITMCVIHTPGTISRLTTTIQFIYVLLMCQVNSYKANYRHNTVQI